MFMEDLGETIMSLTFKGLFSIWDDRQIIYQYMYIYLSVYVSVSVYVYW